MGKSTISMATFNVANSSFTRPGTAFLILTPFPTRRGPALHGHVATATDLLPQMVEHLLELLEHRTSNHGRISPMDIRDSWGYINYSIILYQLYQIYWIIIQTISIGDFWWKA